MGSGITATIHVQSLAYFGDLSMGLASAIWPRFCSGETGVANRVVDGCKWSIEIRRSTAIGGGD
jgi:hypothetical protein